MGKKFEMCTFRYITETEVLYTTMPHSVNRDVICVCNREKDIKDKMNSSHSRTVYDTHVWGLVYSGT